MDESSLIFSKELLFHSIKYNHDIFAPNAIHQH